MIDRSRVRGNTLDDITALPIEQLVRLWQQHGLSRSRFVAILAGLGASATGISTLLAAAESSAATLPSRRKPAHHAIEHHHTALHQAHVQRQAGATHQEPATSGKVHAAAAAQPLGATSAASAARSMSPSRRQQLLAILDDYADEAIVDDPLFERPIAGKRAIGERKWAEMTSMSGVTIDVVHRFAHGKQVVAEWVVRGTHAGPFMGYAPTGRRIEIRGMTVVTRENGKITRESLFYDVAELHRQLT
jgi:steroid delta-isomerase-like uncharacterized protein